MARGLIDRNVDYIKIHPSGCVARYCPNDRSRGPCGWLKGDGAPRLEYRSLCEVGIDGVEHATGCVEETIRSEADRKKLASIRLWLAKCLGSWTLAEEEHFPALIEFLAKKGTVIESTIVLWGAALGMKEKWEREDYEFA